MGTKKTGKQVRSMRKEDGGRAAHEELTQHKEGGGTLGAKSSETIRPYGE